MISDYFQGFDFKSMIRDIIIIDGNGGYTGNSKITESNYNDKSHDELLPDNECEMVTAVTDKQPGEIVTSVTSLLPNTGPASGYRIPPRNGAVDGVLPLLPPLPAKTDNSSTYRCYWCKSTDFWVGSTEKHAHQVCRRCHPPAPGAEVSHATTE